MKSEAEVRITALTICGGNRYVLSALGVPLAGAIESDEEIVIRREELPRPLQVDSRPTASAAVVAGIIGIVLFVGSWAAKKALDELYALKIRPKIKKVFGSREASELPSGRGCKWLFQLGVWYEEEYVLLLLTIVGDSLTDIANQEHLLLPLHASAVDWLIKTGVASPVHLYIVEDGKANLEPLTFNHVDEAQRYIENLWPTVVPVVDRSYK